MRFLTCDPASGSDAIPLYISELSSALGGLGHSLERAGERNLLDVWAEDGADAVIVFNAAGLPDFDAGLEFCRRPLPGKQLAVWLLDQPMVHSERLGRLPPGTVVATSCASHVSVISSGWPELRPLFVPLAPCQVPAGTRPARPWSERSHRVAIFGDLGRQRDRSEFIALFPPSVGEIIDGMLDAALANPSVPLVKVYLEMLEAYGITAPKAPWSTPERDRMSQIVRALEAYVRNIRRRELFLACDAAGIALEIFGAGYEQLEESRRHRVHLAVTAAERSALMDDCRLVITSGAFPNGPDEASLTAMAHGAAVAFEANPYWGLERLPTAELLSYSPTDLASAAARWREALPSPELEAVAAASADRVSQSHSWRTSAKKLLAQMSIR